MPRESSNDPSKDERRIFRCMKKNTGKYLHKNTGCGRIFFIYPLLCREVSIYYLDNTIVGLFMSTLLLYIM